MADPESQLVELVLQGKTEAFEPLVTPYRKILLSLAFRLSLDREEAKEISQETLLRAFRYLRAYDKRRSFKNWLVQILVNVWRSHSRKREYGEKLAEYRFQSASPDPAESHAQEQVRSQLLDCLDGLTRREKEVFLLRDIEDLSVKETANALKISSLSVRVHLSRAREKIRRRVREKYPHLLEAQR